MTEKPIPFNATRYHQTLTSVVVALDSPSGAVNDDSAEAIVTRAEDICRPDPVEHRCRRVVIPRGTC